VLAHQPEDATRSHPEPHAGMDLPVALPVEGALVDRRADLLDKLVVADGRLGPALAGCLPGSAVSGRPTGGVEGGPGHAEGLAEHRHWIGASCGRTHAPDHLPDVLRGARPLAFPEALSMSSTFIVSSPILVVPVKWCKSLRAIPKLKAHHSAAGSSSGSMSDTDAFRCSMAAIDSALK